MQEFRSCWKNCWKCYLLDVDSLWSWSNNELLKGILSKYQYLLDKLLSINNVFFRLYSSVRRVGDGGFKAKTFTRSMEALCVGMLLEAISVEGQNSSQAEESVASTPSHLTVLLCSSAGREEGKDRLLSQSIWLLTDFSVCWGCQIQRTKTKTMLYLVPCSTSSGQIKPTKPKEYPHKANYESNLAFFQEQQFYFLNVPG